MDFLLAFASVLVGLVIGSFLNVVIDRLPNRQSIVVNPPSHCPACQQRLQVKDLIPVLSYAWLRGRCRYCQTRIPIRLLLVELATGAAFGLLYWYFKLSPELAVALYYFCLLLVIAIIDLERQLILNWLAYPAIVIALGLSIFASPQALAPAISDAAIGGVIGFGVFLLIALLSRGGLGWGDVKMAALMGIMLGWRSALVAFFLAIIAGGLTAIALLATHTRGRKQAIPFGPFLALGAMLALLWGSTIWGWYTGLFR